MLLLRRPWPRSRAGAWRSSSYSSRNRPHPPLRQTLPLLLLCTTGWHSFSSERFSLTPSGKRCIVDFYCSVCDVIADGEVSQGHGLPRVLSHLALNGNDQTFIKTLRALTADMNEALAPLVILLFRVIADEDGST